MEGKVRKLLALARDLASQHTDKGIDKASDILLHLIHEGCMDPHVLIQAAIYLLQGTRSEEHETKSQANSLVDRAITQDTNNIALLENAVHCYELTLSTFPDKLNEIVRLCTRILDLDPDHIEAMIILAYHREHPYVALNLPDAIRMLEWAKEIAPDNKLIDFALARLYMESGLFEKAKKLYKKVAGDTQASPKNAQDAQKHIKALNMVSKQKRYRKYGVN